MYVYIYIYIRVCLFLSSRSPGSNIFQLQVDFDTVPETILTRKGREQAENPPDFVLGRVLTPGAHGNRGPDGRDGVGRTNQ